jgi:hypothetical protein
MAEDTSDFLASFKNVIQSEMMGLNTSVEGTVESYSGGLATILPDANKYFSDGDVLPFPKLFKVPIRWPSFNGGLCGVKGPIRAGDKVLVVFAQQARDGTDDDRRFDITDAYAIPCGSAMVGEADDNDNFSLWFLDAYIKITKGGGVKIYAPGGVRAETPSLTSTGNLSAGSGATGTFNTASGNVVTVQDGIITNIF